MIDIANAAASCACGSCKAFDARPSGFMQGAIVHSANDFAAPASARCPHCGELARAGEITCGRVGCREHGAHV